MVVGHGGHREGTGGGATCGLACCGADNGQGTAQNWIESLHDGVGKGGGGINAGVDGGGEVGMSSGGAPPPEEARKKGGVDADGQGGEGRSYPEKGYVGGLFCPFHE